MTRYARPKPCTKAALPAAGAKLAEVEVAQPEERLGHREARAVERLGARVARLVAGEEARRRAKGREPGEPVAAAGVVVSRRLVDHPRAARVSRPRRGVGREFARSTSSHAGRRPRRRGRGHGRGAAVERREAEDVRAGDEGAERSAGSFIDGACSGAPVAFQSAAMRRPRPPKPAHPRRPRLHRPATRAGRRGGRPHRAPPPTAPTRPATASTRPATAPTSPPTARRSRRTASPRPSRRTRCRRPRRR